MIKVVAVNDKGKSEFSLEGKGAVIQTRPDAPIDIENVVKITSDKKIGLQWKDGK